MFFYFIQCSFYFSELLINRMDLKLRTSDVTPPLVRSFYTQAPSLKKLLLSKSPLKSIYATKLFIALGNYFIYLFFFLNYSCFLLIIL